MSYKDKKFRRRLFRDSLGELCKFAFAEPALSLQKRRALVEGIQKGGSIGNPYTTHSMQTPNSLNYHYTQQALLRVCLDKMISYPEIAQNLRKAITKIAALSAWAKTHPNHIENIFEDFAEKMCPEDRNSTLPTTESISHNFQRDFGNGLDTEKVLDFITCSPNNFYKKYRER